MEVNPYKSPERICMEGALTTRRNLIAEGWEFFVPRNLPGNFGQFSMSVCSGIRSPDRTELERVFTAGAVGSLDLSGREPPEGKPAGQLFDLRNDLGEQTNLAEARVEVVSRLKAELTKIRQGARTRL